MPRVPPPPCAAPPQARAVLDGRLVSRLSPASFEPTASLSTRFPVGAARLNGSSLGSVLGAADAEGGARGLAAGRAQWVLRGGRTFALEELADKYETTPNAIKARMYDLRVELRPWLLALDLPKVVMFRPRRIWDPWRTATP